MVKKETPDTSADEAGDRQNDPRSYVFPRRAAGAGHGGLRLFLLCLLFLFLSRLFQTTCSVLVLRIDRENLPVALRRLFELSMLHIKPGVGQEFVQSLQALPFLPDGSS